MADKDIAIRIKIQGTGEQEKNLKSLQLQLDKLTKERRDLNKAQKQNVITLEQASARRAKLNVQIKATRNALRDTEQQILRNNGALRKTGGLSKTLSAGFKRVGQSISSAFIGLFAIQQLIELTREVIEVNRNFELQMTKVGAITGATSEEFNKLSQSARDLGRSTQFTATQVAELQEEFAKLGFTTDEIIAAQEATLNLAIAAQTDLGNAATIVASTLRAFGEDADQATKLTDIMADAFQSTALDISKFETAMAIVGPVANTAGASIAETTGLLGVLSNAGIDASTAGTGLRNIYLDLAKSGLTLDQALNKIQTSTNKNATAMELFGKRGATVATVIADNIDQARDLGVQFADTTGEAQAMADAVGDTLDGAFKRFDSAVEGLFLSFQDLSGDESGGLKGFINDISEGINQLTSFIQRTNGLSVALNAYITFAKAASTPLRVLIQVIDFLGSTAFKTAENMVKNAQIIFKAWTDVTKTIGSLVKAVATGDFSSIGTIISKGFNEAKQSAVAFTANATDAFDKVVKEGAELGNDVADIFIGIKDSAVATYDAYGKKAKETNEEVREESNKTADTEKKNQEKTTGVTKEELEKRAKARKKALGIIRKLQQDNSVLEIKDNEQKALKKLEQDIANQKKSIIENIKNENLRNQALAELEKNFELKKAEIQDKFRTERENKEADAREKRLKKEEEERKAFIQTSLDAANNLANSLVSIQATGIEREKDLKLRSLQAQFEAGKISQEKLDAEVEKVEREAFERKKRLDTAQAAINGIVGVSKTFAQLGWPGGILGAAVVAAQTAAQIVAIQSQQFADGGLLSGPSHAQGGIPFTVGGQGGFEAEGGEAIINKKSTAMYAPLLSAINEAGGGVAFAKGGIAQPNMKFQMGGIASTQASMAISQGLKNEIVQGVAQTLKSIPVVNNATNTSDQAIKVANIQQQANFG